MGKSKLPSNMKRCLGACKQILPIENFIFNNKTHFSCFECMRMKPQRCRVCAKHAIYGYGKDMISCVKHKTDDMNDVCHKKCEYKGCKRNAYFNFKGLKVKFCADHSIPGMINIRRKLCEYIDCDNGATHNLYSLKPKFCSNHATDDMVNVYGSKCEFFGCSTGKFFGFENGKPQFCGEHREKNMINLVSKTCAEERCTKQPCFGEKNGVALFCDEHKSETMINLRENRKCVYFECTKTPCYGKIGEKAQYCADHAPLNTENIISKRCKYENCTKIPCYNFVGLRPIYCEPHSEKGMINVISNRCEYENCESCAIYGYPETKKKLRCEKHILINMIDLSHKICCIENCSSRSHYGLPQSPTSHCYYHKLPKMIKNPMKRCEQLNCRQFAEYGIRTHERCFIHKNEDDINLLESECSKCGKIDILINNICLNFCHSLEEFKKYRLFQKHKENHIVEVIKDSFPNIPLILDKSIERECGKERPDILIQLPTHNIIIEVDEFQHSKGYCKEGELNRMKNITSSFGGIPCIFIRYNPDSYTTPHLHSANYQAIRKEKVLIKWIRYAIEEKLEEICENNALCNVVYLFYDNYDKTNNFLQEIGMI